MSRVSFYTRPYDRLEPYDGKLSRTVLRGGAGSNASLLPDNVFRLTRNGEILNHTYRSISGAKKAARNLVEIAASMITVILVYLTYQNLNLLLNQMLELPVETVLIPGEPFGFATLYLLFYTALSELTAKLRDRKKKKEAKRVK